MLAELARDMMPKRGKIKGKKDILKFRNAVLAKSEELKFFVDADAEGIKVWESICCVDNRCFYVSSRGHITERDIAVV